LIVTFIRNLGEAAIDENQAITTANGGVDETELTTLTPELIFDFNQVKKSYDAKEYSKAFKEEASKVKDPKSVYAFIQDFGTHYVKLAKMGSRFEQSYYFSETTSEEEVSSAQQSASEDSMDYSASGSVSGGGFGVSASASFSHSESESETKENSSSNSSSKSHSSRESTSGSKIFGMVNAAGTECGDIVGEQNILFPV
jgi:hypothetical protein